MSKPNHNASPVFYVKNGQLEHGRVAGIHEPWVNVRSEIDDTSVTTVTLHKSEVFDPYDIAVIGQDLLPEVELSEEKHLSQVAMELVESPEHNAELIVRLGAEALNRYVDDERTERDLGLRTAEELIGSAELVGSNEWKVQELIEGVSSKGYKEGVHNEIILCAMSRDAMFVPAEHRMAVLTEMADTNRRVLDYLYEKYGVRFDGATVYEKSHPSSREVVTVYPVDHKGVSFVETAYYDRDVPHTLASSLQNQRAEIRVGLPVYSFEDGYTTSI